MEIENQKTKNDSCLICGAKTKGLHFGVNACRACAEFFRRSLQIKKTYRCMHGTQKCDLVKWSKNRRMCRFCRFQRCKEHGMTLEEEPKNAPKTKKNSTCIKTAIPSISENKTSEVSFTSYDQRSNLKFKIDLAPLEEAISKILSQSYANSITPGIRLTFMQRLNYGFALFYEGIKPRDPIEITYEFDLLALHKHQWKFLVELAKMLMFCEQFASLNYKDKYLLFKNSWRLIYELERLYSTIEYFGSTIDDWRIMFDDTTAIDFRKVKRLKEMSQETFDKSQSLWIPFQQKQQNLLINPMKALKLTEYELVYLIAQMLWTLQDDEDYSEQTRLVAEDVSEQITNELHNYYVYQIGLTNYAHRLVKLTKLIESSKIVLNAKKDVFILARICDLFECDLTKSELYDWKE